MATKIQAQFDGKKFHPYSPKDAEDCAQYKKNQIMTITIQGTRKAPSVIQMRLYWVCCGIVAENTENKHFNTRDKVDLQCRVGLNFIDMGKSIVDKHGNFHPVYHSISFDNLKQIERTRYFDQAFDLMAEWLGCSVDELKEMGRNE